FYMIPNILKCLQFFIEFSKSKVSTKRISDILSSPKERISGEKVSANNDIVFKNVSVDIDCKKILDNINFKIEKGSTTAIVGTSGSGKSTLLNLLAGFDEKYKGEILIGNKELQTIRLDDWREDIGVVLQDSFLIGDSIKDIIEYSGNKLSDSQIKSYLDE
ncbi:ATP-binding cassette domain-containing protein, partial [Enterococcus cecorum]